MRKVVVGSVLLVVLGGVAQAPAAAEEFVPPGPFCLANPENVGRLLGECVKTAAIAIEPGKTRHDR